MKKELWSPINMDEYRGSYEVSTTGRVRLMVAKNQYPAGMIKIQYIRKDGYAIVSLTGTNGEDKRVRVHRLVAATFICSDSNRPHVNHKNSIRHDNRVENLEWCTPKENMQHAEDNGRLVHPKGVDITTSKLTEDQVMEIYRSSEKQHKLCKEYGVTQKVISFIKTGVTWAHVTGAVYRRKRLTEDVVRRIKFDLSNGLKCRQVAIKYGIPPHRASEIKCGTHWSSVM